MDLSTWLPLALFSAVGEFRARLTVTVLFKGVMLLDLRFRHTEVYVEIILDTFTSRHKHTL